MSPKNNTRLPCSIPSLFLSFALFCILSLSLFFLFYLTQNQQQQSSSSLSFSNKIPPNPNKPFIKVYLADLPRSFNYGLLDKYWSFTADSRLGSDADNDLRSDLSSSSSSSSKLNPKFPPYPENPLIKQYSAEYWILGDLMTPEEWRGNSFAKRVYNVDEADVVFVPFFATLSAELQLGLEKGLFRKKVSGNEDYQRQKEVVDLIRGSDAWKRSGGRDHVFVLTDPVAMWHFKAEIAPAVLLVVDFGGWYRLDSKASDGNSSEMIQHTQVSLLKDVIVPYTHLLPRLHLSENRDRRTLLYFKGAKHRHRGGLVREKLWDLLVNEPDIVMEEGFPNATGREYSIKGMRSSEFCLHPAGDTPTSCRLFDAVLSLCIPVIVSDNIELPFEGMVDYSDFSVFVSVSNALQPNWLVQYLTNISKQQRDTYRHNMAHLQPIFEYDSGHPGGIGPIPPDGAVNHIWKKVYQKLPLIKEAIIREKRKPQGVSVPLRCHCT
ncbi:Exostosin-like [Macleaya cordata]|uniref:Exostosin-like n=1 Tax=Macleaya cordata TaxID=56857 RepID=A0A200PSC7_MACCD|nr:Exostosin-like [Macleaya cordata]